MDFNEEIAGEGTQGERPDWEPLEKLVGYDGADDFKWMYEVELVDGTEIHVYRHIETREWLHLSTDGTAFVYTRSGRYRRAPARWMAELVCYRR